MAFDRSDRRFGLKGIADVRDFGAVGDGVADDTAAIRQAIEYAGRAGRGSVVSLPPSAGYVITDTIRVPRGISWRQDARLLCGGAAGRTWLEFGAAGIGNAYVDISGIHLARMSPSDWTDETDIGVRIINAYSCKISIRFIGGFSVGMEAAADGGGWAACDTSLGTFRNCGVSLDVTSRNGGWPNDNLWTGGLFASWSTHKRGQPRTGIRLRSLDGSYTGTNNNVFLKPLLEWHVKDTETIPIHVLDGIQNWFLQFRSEGDMSHAARTENESTENWFAPGYDNGKGLDDRSRYGGNILVGSRTRYKQTHSRVVARFDLRDRYRNEAGIISMDGMSILRSPNPTPRATTDTGIDLEAKGVRLYHAHAVGVMLDVAAGQSLLVCKGAPRGENSGRVILQAYDENGGRLEGNDPYYAVGPIYSPGYWNPTSWGGCYMQGSDGGTMWFVRLRREVYSVWVGLAGSSAAVVHSLTISTQPGEEVGVRSGR